MKNALINGDSLNILKKFPDNSFDSMVTDPPAGIAFMGKKWDKDKGGRDLWISWLETIMVEAFRTLKPGAHILVWAIPRTSHWTATAIENADFEIRDVVTHIFGSGFPKSQNISKAIDKNKGIERTEVIGTRHRNVKPFDDKNGWNQNSTKGDHQYMAPASDDAKKWDGWGSALKPASEHWILARKPLSEKTIVANVLEHGTGGINIDESRIKAGENQGRFPANLILSHKPGCKQKCDDDCAIKEINEQSLAGGMHSAGGKERKSGESKQSGEGGLMGVGNHEGNGVRFGDKGGASRFYKSFEWECEDDCPVQTLDKQSGKLNKQAVCKSDDKSGWQNKYVGGEGVNSVKRELYLDEGGASRFFYCAKASKKEKTLNKTIDNKHPTVKPLKLMKYLIKMITPPGGTILDPFMGSGTTGQAAIEEDFGFVGVELEINSYDIAKKRIPSIDNLICAENA